MGKSLRNQVRERKYDSIRCVKDNYIVEYEPFNYYAKNSASLDFTFSSSEQISSIKKTIEKELAFWVEKYPLTTFCYAGYDSDSDVELPIYSYVKNDKNEYEFLWLDNKGYSKYLTSKKNQISNKELKRIYNDLDFKTIDKVVKENEEEDDRRIKSAKVVNFLFIVFPIVLVISFELVLYYSLFLSTIVSFYTIVKVSLNKFGHKTKRQKAKSEKDRLKNEYYYYCQRDLYGFQKLKENVIQQESITKFNQELASANKKEKR